MSEGNETRCSEAVLLTPDAANAEMARGNTEVRQVLMAALNPSSAEEKGIQILGMAEKSAEPALMILRVIGSGKTYAVPITGALAQLALDRHKQTGTKSEIYQLIEGNLPAAKYVS